MSEPKVSTPDSKPPSKTGLTVFGVLGILLGAAFLLLAAGLAAMSFYAQSLPNGSNLTFKTQIPGILFYTFAGFFIATLGWGTLKARLWALRLSLIVAWASLLSGLVTMVFMGFILPDMLDLNPAQPMLPGVKTVVLVFTFLFMGVMFVVLPLIGVLFYRHPKVKAAFDYHGQGSDWTDRCPPSVLAAALAHGACALYFIGVTPFMNFMNAFFNTFLWGWQGFLVSLIQIPLFVYVAWGTYRLDRRSWIISLWVHGWWAVSYTWAFWNTDYAELNAQMGFAPEMVQQLSQMKLISTHAMALWIGVFWSIWLGYLVWIGKHFKKASHNS